MSETMENVDGDFQSPTLGYPYRIACGLYHP